MLDHLKALLVALLGLAVTVIGLPVATGAEAVDTVAPEIVALDVDIEAPLAPGESFTVRMQTSEPVHVYMSYRSPLGKTRTPQGDITPGVTESFPFTIGDDYEDGEWVLESVSVADRTGNRTNYYADGRVTRNPSELTGPSTHALDLTDDSFTVYGSTVDTVGPQILALDVDAEAPLAAGESFIVRMQTSEPVHVYMSYRSPLGKTRTPQGDITPGVTESFPFTIGDDYENGQWVLESVSVADRTGNRTNYYADGRVTRNPSGLTGPSTHALDLTGDSFAVYGSTVDTEAPRILSFSAGSTAPLAPGESFSVRMQTSEPVHVYMSYRSPLGKTRTPQGDITPGVTESFPFTIGDDYEDGEWVLESVSVTDRTGNRTNYYRDGRVSKEPSGLTGPTTHALDFYPTSFTVLRAPSEAPTDVSGTADQFGAVDVSWTAPADAALVTSYRVTASPGDRSIVVTSSVRTVRFTGLPGGSYTFTVTPANQSGDGPTSAPSNEAVVVPYVDTQAPVVTIWTPVPSFNRNATETTFKVEEEAVLARTECSLDGAPFVTCSSGWNFTRPTDGEHEIRVRAIDSAGNGSIATRVFNEDHTAPVVQATAGPGWSVTGGFDALTFTNATTIRWEWRLSDALSGVGSWSCKFDGEWLRDGQCTETGAELTNVPPGSHTLMLSVRDKAGNGNVNNVYLDFVVDTSAPGVTITKAPASKTQDQTATVAFSVSESGTTATCQLDDKATEYCQSGTVTYPHLTLGDHRLLIQVKDRAGNIAEKTVTWTVVKVPDAPGSVHAVPGDQEALVYWTQPAEYGLPVTGYVITASPGGRTVTVPSDRTGASVSGLTNGTKYTFTVTATTAWAGTSSASTPSNEVTPAGWPDMPRQVRVERVDHSALVSWDPADGRGAPVTGYTVTMSPGDQVYRLPADQTSLLVDGLDGVGPYSFRISATTWVGESSASYPATVIFAEVPDAPTGVRAVRANHAATVYWTPPTDNGGIAISDYTITVQPGGQTLNVGTERNEFTVSGLTNGTAYTFTVAANNAAGRSAESAASTPVVPAGVPSRVARPDVARKGAQAAVVRWSAPETNFSPIKRYRIIPSIGKIKVVSGDVRRVVFKSLRKGRYEFRVVAANGVGSSLPSRPGVIRIPAR